MHTRIAPTPSGYLHLGNAANALATWWWAQSADAEPSLRIDDLDAERYRPEYADDIFDLLDWLGIAWNLGPRNADETEASRSTRIAALRSALTVAREAGLPVYACRCSRRAVGGLARGGCPGGCRSREHDLVPHESALRLAVDPGTTIKVDRQTIDLANTMGDAVLWRRDDLPAYQWASTLEDDAHGITHILRGHDLMASSAFQLHLARQLDLPLAERVTIRHHALLLDQDGEKLSKSQMGSARPLARDSRTRATIEHHARQFATSVGITPPAGRTSLP